ncbi:hypothetical protein [Scytonema sp. PRP1]|uniref:hypothetical protein n=1 Tax=Scytonema sp. PRP1 TaxID=3120513 RepID=UPI002FD6ECE4
MGDSAEQLLTSAREKFGHLTEVDEKLFRAVVQGKAADFSSDADELNEPAKSDEWNHERTLSADRIVWLCTNTKARELLTYRGICIIGAKVEGYLDLSFATIEVPLLFIRCTFSESISLLQARLRFLSLKRTHVISINATGIQVEGSVLLKDGFEAKGEVRLLGAFIGGQLNCSSGHFFNEKGYALSASSANITADVYLSDGFEAKGAVQLWGACIGGDLDCSDGHFFNQEKYALVINGANIEGDVYFTNSFTAQGRVSLVSTRIDDTLYLKQINNPQQMILDLSFARVNTLADEAKSWPGENRLHLNGFTYNTISESSPPDSKQRLKWLRLQPEQEFALQPYEQLAGVLRTNGHEDAAIEILIGKQRDRLRYGGLKGWELFWNRFLGKTIAYGYRPQRALWYSLVAVILGTFLFWRGYEAGLISPASNFGPFDESKLNSEVSVNYPVFNPLVYSLDVFLPIVDFHQESHWLPNSKKTSDKTLLLFFKTRSDIVLRWYFWLHIVLGWVFTSLWVAGFTGLIRSQNK